MPKDLGLNPTGTIAELYVNYGFLAVLLGGILCFFICHWNERILLIGETSRYAWLCSYPLLSEWYFCASYNFTQRLSEGFHLIMFLWFMMLFLWFAKKRPDTFMAKISPSVS
jgi:hypothetical protein